jgi:kinesin family protein 15
VDGIIEETVSSPSDAGRVLTKGYLNRHVGETTMNRESSRSHAVFLLNLQSKEDKDGVLTYRTSRFSLVDLAGRQRHFNVKLNINDCFVNIT